MAQTPPGKLYASAGVPANTQHRSSQCVRMAAVGGQQAAHALAGATAAFSFKQRLLLPTTAAAADGKGCADLVHVAHGPIA